MFKIEIRRLYKRYSIQHFNLFQKKFQPFPMLTLPCEILPFVPVRTFIFRIKYML